MKLDKCSLDSIEQAAMIAKISKWGVSLEAETVLTMLMYIRAAEELLGNDDLSEELSLARIRLGIAR